MNKEQIQKETEEKIVTLLEDHKKMNDESFQIWNGLDIAISIIKTYQEEREISNDVSE